MASQNLLVVSFVVAGATTFTVSAAGGVYVEKGYAGGPKVVDRILTLPTGAIHDLDGTDAAALTPPAVWWDLLFEAAHPGAHTQYSNLLALVGRHGTLTAKLLNATTGVNYAAPARLKPLDGSWEAPMRTATQHWLTIKATWQLKDFWA